MKRSEKWHRENEPLRLCREAGEGFSLWAEIGAAAGIFLFCRAIAILLAHFLSFLGNDFFGSADFAYLFTRLTADGIGIGVVLSFAVRFQRRSLRSLGFLKEKWFLFAPGGLAAGALFFALPLSIGLAAGSFSYEGVPLKGSAGRIALFFLALLCRALFEETLFTGLFAVSAARKIPSLAAAAIASLLAALPSLAGDGAGAIAVLNSILFHFLLGLFFFAVRGDLFGIGFFRAGWLFAQGCLFGLPVCGMGRMPSIFVFVPKGAKILSGGAFGAEGGLWVTLVLGAAIGFVFLFDRKRRKNRDLSSF